MATDLAETKCLLQQLILLISVEPHQQCKSMIDLSKTYVYDNITWDLKPTTESSEFDGPVQETEIVSPDSAASEFVKAVLKDFLKYCDNVLLFKEDIDAIEVYEKVNKSKCSDDFRSVDTWMKDTGDT